MSRLCVLLLGSINRMVFCLFCFCLQCFVVVVVVVLVFCLSNLSDFKSCFSETRKWF